jgi:hypothetical protein
MIHVMCYVMDIYFICMMLGDVMMYLRCDFDFYLNVMMMYMMIMLIVYE